MRNQSACPNYGGGRRDSFPVSGQKRNRSDLFDCSLTDAKEIESQRYGLLVFGGYMTRIELQEDLDRGEIAKTWGGYEGVAISNTQKETLTAASVVDRRLVHPYPGLRGV